MGLQGVVLLPSFFPPGGQGTGAELLCACDFGKQVSTLMEHRNSRRRVTERGFSARGEELKRAQFVLLDAWLSALSFCPWCFAVCGKLSPSGDLSNILR